MCGGDANELPRTVRLQLRKSVGLYLLTCLVKGVYCAAAVVVRFSARAR